jgi:hypothetical protein
MTLILQSFGMTYSNFEHASHVAMSVNKLLSRIVAPDAAVDWTGDGSNKRNASELHDHTFGITSDPLTQFAVVLSALSMSEPSSELCFCWNLPIFLIITSLSYLHSHPPQPQCTMLTIAAFLMDSLSKKTLRLLLHTRTSQSQSKIQ